MSTSSTRSRSDLISLSDFHLRFSEAIRTYHKRTKNDLLFHPLASLFQSCNDSTVALSLLQRHAQVSRPLAPRISDEQLKSLLSPTLSGLYNISLNGDEGVGLVLSPERAILVAIGVLLSDAQASRHRDGSQDRLMDIFTRMGRSFDQLPPDTSLNAKKKFMLDVLSILTSATVEVKQGKARKIVRQLSGKNEVDKALEKLHKLVQDKSTLRESHNPSADLVRPGHNVPITSTTNHLDEKNVAIENWLNPPDLERSLNLMRKVRLEGTAEWFLYGSQFKQWKSSGTLFWIHGMPGAGKSTLCSAIVDDIKDTCKSSSTSTNMAYFAFDFKDNHKQTRLDMIPSLLTQLAARSEHCRELLSRLYSAHNRGAQKPTGAVLTECLKDMVSSPNQSHVYIVVDGIDESPNSPGVPSPREEVLEVLEKLVKLRLPNLRLCVTSRPELDIKGVLQPLQPTSLSLHDEEGQKNAIRDYIEHVVHSDQNMGRWGPEVKYLVINTLSERAGGMFRLVSYQLDILKPASPQTVPHILGGLPKTLEESYEGMLMKINMTLRKPVFRLLQCLVVAVRPLRVEELARIFSMDFDDEEVAPKNGMDWGREERAVLSACASFIDVFEVGGSREIHFTHPSVKQFLTSKRLKSSSDRFSFYYIRKKSAHKLLAQSCLPTLLRPVDQINMDSNPLADYAARYWVDHVESGDVTLFDGTKQLFDAQEPHFSAWIAAHDIDERVSSTTDPAQLPPQGSPLYYAALCGLYDLAEHLLDVRPEDINVEGGRYKTAIHAALYKGHFPIAQLLLRSGADVNSRDQENSTPLHIATRNGDTRMMERLISYGADVNATESTQSASSCPLFIALDDRNLKAISLLVDNGADVNVRDDKGSSPLHIASRTGEQLTDLVKELLVRRADVHAKDNQQSTPLHLATLHGDPTIVQTLIEYGANVNDRDDLGSTALSLALLNDNFEILKFLVDHGADVNIPNDHQEQSPLHLAALRGNFEIARLLVEHGANVNARNKGESTPIHLASNNSFEIARLLIDHGADLTVEDNNRTTPLHLASDDGNFDLVRLLIERGADVNARDRQNSTPLHAASRRGPVEAVQLLLDNGAETKTQNDKGWTALHLASQEGAVDIVKCLLTRGRAETNIGDGDRRTPLHLASANQNSKIVRLLIEAGADPFVRDVHNQIPYQLSSATSQRLLAPSSLNRSPSPSPYNRPMRLPSPEPSSSGSRSFGQVERRTALKSPPSSPN